MADFADERPVVFVAPRTRFLILMLILLAAGSLLVAIGRVDGDRGLLYFFAYPCVALAVGGLVLLAVRRPARIVIGRGWVEVNGQRSPGSEIVVGDPVVVQRGNMLARVFSLTTLAPDGRMQDLEINALAWPQFDRMHQLLSACAASKMPAN